MICRPYGALNIYSALVPMTHVMGYYHAAPTGLLPLSTSSLVSPIYSLTDSDSFDG
jgi:hypothetical protein